MSNTRGPVNCHEPVSGQADRAAIAIRRQIHERGLRPGDVIGTEAGLASALGVSRNAVREAVGRLRGLGLVESRQSKGLVVAHSNPAAVMSLVLPHYAVDSATTAELGELRYAIELGAIDMAVTRASPEDVRTLGRLGLEFMETVVVDQVRADEIDAAFHQAILQATGNALLRDMHIVISEYFRRARAEYADWYRAPTSHTWEHAAIAEAFADRDAERARALMRAHLRPVIAVRRPEAGPTTQPQASRPNAR